MKPMYQYVFPIWIGMMINTLLGLTDMLFLNHMDIKYITVVGVASIPLSLVGTVFIGIGIEANRSMSSDQRISFHQIIGIVVFSAFALYCICRIFNRQILFYAKGHELIQLIVDYYNINMFILVPSSILYYPTGGQIPWEIKCFFEF